MGSEDEDAPGWGGLLGVGLTEGQVRDALRRGGRIEAAAVLAQRGPAGHLEWLPLLAPSWLRSGGPGGVEGSGAGGRRPVGVAHVARAKELGPRTWRDLGRLVRYLREDLAFAGLVAVGEGSGDGEAGAGDVVSWLSVPAQMGGVPRPGPRPPPPEPATPDLLPIARPGAAAHAQHSGGGTARDLWERTAARLVAGARRAKSAGVAPGDGDPPGVAPVPSAPR